MAERRMFAKIIIDSDAFLDMPISARLLYYDLSMRADDDGFVNSPKKITRVTGATSDDLKILIAKNFIIPFENGVVVIKHWKIHNYIRKDTYKETTYTKEKRMLSLDGNNSYTIVEKPTVISDRRRAVDEPSTQVRLGKDRLDKDSIYISAKADVQSVFDAYNSTCTKLPKANKLTDKRKQAIKKFLKEFTVEEFNTICVNANNTEFYTGKNDRKWRANLDFLIRPDKAVKLLEIKESNKPKSENWGVKF